MASSAYSTADCRLRDTTTVRLCPYCTAQCNRQQATGNMLHQTIATIQSLPGYVPAATLSWKYAHQLSMGEGMPDICLIFGAPQLCWYCSSSDARVCVAAYESEGCSGTALSPTSLPSLPLPRRLSGHVRCRDVPGVGPRGGGQPWSSIWVRCYCRGSVHGRCWHCRQNVVVFSIPRPRPDQPCKPCQNRRTVHAGRAAG